MISQDASAIDAACKGDVIDGVLTNVVIYNLRFFISFTTIVCDYDDLKNIS